MIIVLIDFKLFTSWMFAIYFQKIDICSLIEQITICECFNEIHLIKKCSFESMNNNARKGVFHNFKLAAT